MPMLIIWLLFSPRNPVAARRVLSIVVARSVPNLWASTR